MAKSNDEGDYYSLRCSRTNPQHVYVNKILTDLNLDIFKSKNQFIVDAIEAYSKMLDQDNLTVSAVIEKSRKEGYITRNDLEEIKREISDRVVKEVQNEVISLLGTALAARQNVMIPAETCMQTANIQQTVNQTKEVSDEISNEMVGVVHSWVD